MPKNTKTNGPGSRIIKLASALQSEAPSFYALQSDEELFRGLVFKTRDDGTTLAVCKSWFDDGQPSVCFAVGYGLVATIVALDATIAGGNWKPDKYV